MSQADWDNLEYFPPYLEVLRANEEPEVVWSGVSGQISRLESVVNQRDKQLRAKFAEVQAEVAEVRAKVDDRMDALDQKLFAELAELKALLVDKEE